MMQSRWMRRVAVGIAVVAAFLIGMSLRSGPPADHADAPAASETTTWTCSMHPQIQLPEPGPCPICGMDLIPAATSAGDEGPGATLTLSPAAQKLADIQTTRVVRSSVTTAVRLTGTLEPDETRVRHIAARVGGRIDRLFIDFTGLAVSKGERLFDLYSPVLLSAQEELIQAKRQGAARTLAAARERLRLWGLSDAQVTAIESSHEPREHVTIEAPMGGIVLHKNAVEGAYVSTGTTVYTIADLSTLWLELEAYERDLPWIQLGQSVTFETRSHPGQTFEGTVAFIDPVLKAESRSATVRVDVPNPGSRLKPGLFVQATLHAHVEDASDLAPLVIPTSAALVTGERAVVYVADADRPGRFHGRTVVLGPRTGDRYVVVAGLEEGERVVSNGAFKIDSALQIVAKPSMMSPDEADDYETQAQAVDTPETFRRGMDAVLKPYYAVSTALSVDDVDAAKAAAEHVVHATGAVDAGALSAAAQAAWREARGSIERAGGEIAAAADIETARRHFQTLSITLIDAVRRFGATGDTPVLLYHCPMADGGKGADWLQDHTGAENPYYGSAMYGCGAEAEVLVPAEDGAR